MDIILFLISLGLVIYGGKIFLEGSVSLSKLFRVSELIIGASLVSLATTMPETLISFFGGLTNHTQIALGNVLGTPIINLGLIGSLVLFFTKREDPRPHRGKRRSLVFYILSLFLFTLFLKTTYLTTTHALFLIFLSILYLLFMLNIGEHLKIHELHASKETGKSRIILKFLFGALVLIVGSRLLIFSTVNLARDFNIPEYLIGLYIVALGTSIPELTTAILAIVKHEQNIAIGNLTGASILTITLALGVSCLIRPIVVTPRAINLDLPFIIFLSLLVILERFFVQIPKKLVALILLSTYFLYLTLVGKS